MRVAGIEPANSYENQSESVTFGRLVTLAPDFHYSKGDLASNSY